jgi:hypothetical protein
MTDATGHKDWPGAGPDSFQESVDGLPVPYYTHPNPISGRTELMRINPPGTLDEFVTDFPDRDAALIWLRDGWRTGRLPLATQS